MSEIADTDATAPGCAAVFYRGAPENRTQTFSAGATVVCVDTRDLDGDDTNDHIADALLQLSTLAEPVRTAALWALLDAVPHRANDLVVPGEVRLAPSMEVALGHITLLDGPMRLPALRALLNKRA